MKFNELPIKFQESLNKERENLKGVHRNNAYEVLLYNSNGTRYFSARRKSIGTTWAGFGGGSYWVIRYGAVQFTKTKNPLGGLDYEWTEGKQYGSKTFENGDVVIIPKTLETKKEVLALARSLKCFDI